MKLATLPAASAPAVHAPGAPAAVPDVRDAAPAATASVPETTESASDKAARRSGRALTVTSSVGGVVLAGIGFTGSYNALKDLAFKHGFGQFSYAFPIGIDAGIVVLYALDLYLIRRHTPWPMLRTLAHLLTAATIVFNAAAAEGPVSADPIGTAMHAVIPIMFIAAVEAARRLVVRSSDIEAGRDSQTIPAARWVLSPGRTAALWRRMKLWNTSSYQETVQIEQERTVYAAMLQRKYGRGWRRKAPADAMLPLTMARYGLTVDEALALPRQAREAEQLRAEENERLELEAQQRAERRAAEARIHSIRTQGDIRAAEHQTEAAVDAAAASANATRTEAEVAAEAQARIAQQTALAIESADAAEARRRAAEAEAATSGARARAAEVSRVAAEAEEAASEARRRTEENDRQSAALEAERLRAEQDAAEAKRRAAEARAAAAGVELRAVEAEDAARLSPRERTVRKVARIALTQHAGQVEQLPLAAITDAVGVSESTASEYRKEAGALIAGGYRIH
ncbi:DUF2637 domain-containing protein [Streptomyces sp. LBUM 1486]|uniref:DUF2637 domain-containing protein n=1 Tax=Streptomyces scabiei TaxID=1930 RepID=UPI001B31A855|nr:DUF2637 domain-containing protein [Streptomyces sp. LBUM 1486]MBP5915754.1 DUF2637 domain-containing protein [Streptomyces sp. LBUM 1486]